VNILRKIQPPILGGFFYLKTMARWSLADEEPTIKALHEFIKESGYKLFGPHEEEYLSRPGSKAKTIIRSLIKK